MAKRLKSSAPTWKRRKRKQNRLKVKVYLIGPFCFASQDAIVCMTRFRIDSRTIKRGEFMVDAVIKCH